MGARGGPPQMRGPSSDRGGPAKYNGALGLTQSAFVAAPRLGQRELEPVHAGDPGMHDGRRDRPGRARRHCLQLATGPDRELLGDRVGEDALALAIRFNSVAEPAQLIWQRRSRQTFERDLPRARDRRQPLAPGADKVEQTCEQELRDPSPQAGTVCRSPPSSRGAFKGTLGLAMQRAQKITLGEMRESGPTRLIVYCSDCRCAHSVLIDAGR
jgi:hypothetical protein